MVKNFGVNGVQDAFLSYDVDGSGSITRDELKARFLIKRLLIESQRDFSKSLTIEAFLKEWMTRHGRFLTRRQVSMMIDAVDVNDDGEIDYEEFLVSIIRH